MNKLKLTILAAIAVMGVVSPAFAENTGEFANVLPYTASTPPYPIMQNRAVRANGPRAFAYAPARDTAWAGSDANLAGGSIGYNAAEESSIATR